MATAKFNWMNDKGEVYELVVDELGNPINFTLTADDKVVLNDKTQKPVEIIDIKDLEFDISQEEDMPSEATPLLENTKEPEVSKEKKKRGRPKKQS